MPFKYNQFRHHHFKKPSISTKDCRQYNQALKMRGDMTIWLSQDVIENWYERDRVYDGTGTPNLYTEMAIFTVHEIRQVFKLSLRQCEGFINSIFKLMKVNLKSPSYSVLSKRLARLSLSRPFYRNVYPDLKNIKSLRKKRIKNCILALIIIISYKLVN